MNKKGQVLVMFLLLIPALFMILALVVDLGMLLSKTYKIKSSVKEAISYGLKTNDIEAMEVLLNNNVDGEYTISTNGNIEIKVKGSYKAILGNIFNKDFYKYEFKYLGYIDNENIVITEE